MSEIQSEKERSNSNEEVLGTQDEKQKKTREKNEISRDHDIEVESVEDQKMERAVAKIIQSEFSGPIPPPSIISGYEETLPGAADRILAMAEKQSEHRQNMERIMVTSESRDGLLGILFAFILGMGCIIAAIVIVVMVPQNAGAISGALIGVTGIGSIIATFIKSTRQNTSKRNNDSEKD